MYVQKYKKAKTTPTTPATAKQEPKKKPSPLGEGGPRQGCMGVTRYLPRLPPNQRTYPNHYHANKTALHMQGHTIPQASSPSPSPHGRHLSPKGEALVYAVGVCTSVLSLLASIIGSRNL